MEASSSKNEGGVPEEMLDQLAEVKTSNCVEGRDSLEDSGGSGKSSNSKNESSKTNEGREAWGFCMPFADKSGRWHLKQRGLVRTSDFLGDHLAMVFREAAWAGEGSYACANCASDLMMELTDYEDESRLLFKLADTGRVVQAIESATETALGLLHLRGSPEAKAWRQELQKERDQQVQRYQELLDDEDRLRVELGDEQQQVELQTLLKYGLQKYEGLLTSGERDAMMTAFDASVRLSGILVTAVPAWFATAEGEWPQAQKSSIAGGEEACLREVAVWATLQHPNVRKFYGACHVGKKVFVIHELAWKLDYRANFNWLANWRQFLGCARGMLYVHERCLVHEDLTDRHLRKMEDDMGGLSGLGLVRSFTDENTLQEGSGEHVASTIASQCPSSSNDVMQLGTLVFQQLVKNQLEGPESDLEGSYSNSEYSESGAEDSEFVSGDFERELSEYLGMKSLPDTKPDFVGNDEWHLLQGMCAANPADRISMLDVVYQMAILADQEEATSSDDDEPNTCLETVSDVYQYQVASLGQTLGDALDDAASWCDDVDPELAAVQRPVCDRLADIYKQLLASPTPLSLRLVDQFGDIVRRFSVMLERREGDSCGYSYNLSQSSVGALCASRTIAGRNYGLHNDIDRLLREYSDEGLENSAEVHQWQPSMKKLCQRQRQTLETLVEDPSSMLEGMESEAERSEALALLQSEAQSTGLSTAGTLNALPEWFIPPHRVQLGKHLADGSFGAVYEGLYLDSPVVVKQVLTSGLGTEERRQFLQEADLWYSLNHRNLIQLYGACHEGRPFFVCERVMGGTIVERAKAEDLKTAWWMLGCAAKGLEHLHANGIVHGDLKGNNILVGEDSRHVKLADFGLSFAANQMGSSTAADGGALGAFRWKAPEVLKGGKATFASDIFSFGMCIIEAVTGKFPWGNSIPDAAVKYNVVERRLLPQRPEGFSDKQWGLVARMCCYDPEERITAGAVVGILLEVLSVLFGDGLFDPSGLEQ